MNQPKTSPRINTDNTDCSIAKNANNCQRSPKVNLGTGPASGSTVFKFGFFGNLGDSGNFLIPAIRVHPW